MNNTGWVWWQKQHSLNSFLWDISHLCSAAGMRQRCTFLFVAVGSATNSGLLNIWSVLSLISHSHAALLSFNHYSSCPKNYLKTPLEIFFTTENQNELFRIPGAQVNTSTVTPFPAGSLNALHMSYPIPVMVPSPCLSDTKSPHLAPHLIFFFMLLSL